MAKWMISYNMSVVVYDEVEFRKDTNGRPQCFTRKSTLEPEDVIEIIDSHPAMYIQGFLEQRLKNEPEKKSHRVIHKIYGAIKLDNDIPIDEKIWNPDKE